MTHQDVPTSSTIHLVYVPTHQLLVSTIYPTCTSTKIPHQFHHPNLICNSVIDLVYMITYLVEFWLILERELVECASQKIFFVWILESIIKIIYPPLNLGLLYFTFPLKFGLDILWLPQSPVHIQYAQALLK
jgi:hypothetical protein